MRCRAERALHRGALALALVVVGASARGEVVAARWVDAGHVSVTATSLRWGTTGAATASLVDAAQRVNATPATPAPSAFSGATTVLDSDSKVEVAGGQLSASYRSTRSVADASATSATVTALLNLLGTFTLKSSTGSINVGADCRANAASSGTSTALTALRSDIGGMTREPSVTANTAAFPTVSLSIPFVVEVQIGPSVTLVASTVSAPGDPAVVRRLILNPGIIVTLLGLLPVTLATPITLVEATCALDLP